MQLAFDFWDILEVFCIIAFMYRGIQDILGKGKPRKKEQEEYEALHVFSGITLISLSIAALAQKQTAVPGSWTWQQPQL